MTAAGIHSNRAFGSLDASWFIVCAQNHVAWPSSPAALADQVDELLDHHGLVGDLTVANGVAVGGHRDGDDPGHVGAETVCPLAETHRFYERFVSLPVAPGACGPTRV